MVYRLNFTFDGTTEKVNLSYIAATTFGYTLLPGTYESSGSNLINESLKPNHIKVIATVDFIRLRKNLTLDKTIMFTTIFFSTHFRI